MDITPQAGPQTDFLSTDADIAIFGGSAGGGKTFAILLDFLRHFNNPRAGAVYFRRTYPQIKNEGGLWDAALKIYNKLGGKPKEGTSEIILPSKAKIKFAHMQYEKNRFDWQGSEIPVIYFDELTHFTQRQFFYMLSRNRSTSGIKPYVRCTTNPDADSWVRKFLDWWISEDGYPIPGRSGKVRWFYQVEDKLEWDSSKENLIRRYPSLSKIASPKSVTFIPSKLQDNKILMEKDPGYLANLLALPKVEKERLLEGNWNIRPIAGIYFKSYYFEEVEATPPLKEIVRCWDRAATKWREGDQSDPDYTVGLKLGRDHNGIFYVLDIVRVRESAYKVEELIKNTAIQDGINVKVKGFQDPGGAGKNEAENFIRMLAGFNVVVEKITKDKITASLPVSAQAEAGNIKVLKTCRNKEDFYREVENFPEGTHDDCLDALSGAFNEIALPSSGDWTEDMTKYESSGLIDDLTW